MRHRNDLSASYWRYLRLYPRRWRTHHGPGLVGVLLDQAHEEKRAAPNWKDRHDLVLGAIAARFAFWDPNGRLAEVAMGLGLGTGLVYLAVSIDPAHGEGAGPFANPTYLAVVFWIAAYVASLAHRPLAARCLVTAALVGHAVIALSIWVLPVTWLGPSLFVTVPFLALGVAASAREVRRREAVATAVVIPALVIAATSAVVKLVAT